MVEQDSLKFYYINFFMTIVYLNCLVSYASPEAAVIHEVIDGGNLISLIAVLQYTGI